MYLSSMAATKIPVSPQLTLLHDSATGDTIRGEVLRPDFFYPNPRSCVCLQHEYNEPDVSLVAVILSRRTTCNVFFALEQELKRSAGFPVILNLSTASWNAQSKEGDCESMVSSLQSRLVAGRRQIRQILDMKQMSGAQALSFGSLHEV